MVQDKDKNKEPVKVPTKKAWPAMSKADIEARRKDHERRVMVSQNKGGK